MTPRSWLTKRNPPAGPVKGEEALWWAMIRRAAVDLLRSHESDAMDAAEFLSVTGVWLCEELFGVKTAVTSKEIVRLMKRSKTLRGKLNVVASTEAT